MNKLQNSWTLCNKDYLKRLTVEIKLGSQQENKQHNNAEYDRISLISLSECQLLLAHKNEAFPNNVFIQCKDNFITRNQHISKKFIMHVQIMQTIETASDYGLYLHTKTRPI